MAASSAWRKRLIQHEIFDVLRKNQDTISRPTESKNILVVKDGDLFVWDAYNHCILTTNLKVLVRDKIGAEYEIESGANAFHGYQTFRCNCPPTFDVENIIFNTTGTYLALIGRKGVTVVELPRRWGKYAQFEDGNLNILCKTICVGERLFMNACVRLLHAQWHPGSSTDTHIVLLTNDNCIRIFDLMRAEYARQTCPLGVAVGDDYTDSYADSPSRLQIPVVLGDVAVGFDFGPPVELVQKSSSTPAKTDNAWPIYILWGNGDVFLLITTLATKGLNRHILQGPLTMSPPAEDNYGTDASAIVCLNSTPPVVAIATCEGRLYHCVVLSEERDINTSLSSETSREASSASWGIYRPLPTSTLYVFENLELELSLTTISVETDEPILDDYTCLIRLQKDPLFCDRYYCVHGAGLHTIVLPWIKSFQQFCEQAEPRMEMLEAGRDQQAVAEHLVCTKPLQSTEAAPICGMSVTDDPLLGSTLICITASLECIILPLLQHHRTPPLPLLSEQATARVPSPLKKLYREPFDQHIRTLLQRTSSNPLLKSAKDTEVSTKECFQLLSRVTQVFREEHMQKLDLARDEILKRVRLLRDIKIQQMSDLERAQHTKSLLVTQARDLAEKYEEANERQDAINDRLESILRKLQSRLPHLSEAETNMKHELNTIEDNIRRMKQTIEQLRQKKDYQEKQVAEHQRAQVVVGSGFDQAQSKQLRNMLRKEGDDISDLVKMVNDLRQTLGR